MLSVTQVILVGRVILVLKDPSASLVPRVIQECLEKRVKWDLMERRGMLDYQVGMALMGRRESWDVLDLQDAKEIPVNRVNLVTQEKLVTEDLLVILELREILGAQEEVDLRDLQETKVPGDRWDLLDVQEPWVQREYRESMENLALKEMRAVEVTLDPKESLDKKGTSEIRATLELKVCVDWQVKAD